MGIVSPIKVGIFLSTTEFCGRGGGGGGGGLPGAVNSLSQGSVYHIILESFIFPTVIQPDIFDIDPIFGFEFLDPYRDHFNLVTLSLQGETVATVTEFVNHNQPMPFPTHTFMFE